MNIAIHKFKENGIIPGRGYDSDVGADLFSPVAFSIEPGETYSLNLEIGITLPEGMSGFVWPKSSLAKRGIINMVPPIDPGYEGPIHALIFNGSGETISFERGDKIGQLVILPFISPDFILDTDKEKLKKRGAGWNGSSGTKKE